MAPSTGHFLQQMIIGLDDGVWCSTYASSDSKFNHRGLCWCVSSFYCSCLCNGHVTRWSWSCIGWKTGFTHSNYIKSSFCFHLPALYLTLSNHIRLAGGKFLPKTIFGQILYPLNCKFRRNWAIFSFQNFLRTKKPPKSCFIIFHNEKHSQKRPN